MGGGGIPGGNGLGNLTDRFSAVLVLFMFSFTSMVGVSGDFLSSSSASVGAAVVLGKVASSSSSASGTVCKKCVNIDTHDIIERYSADKGDVN